MVKMNIFNRTLQKNNLQKRFRTEGRRKAIKFGMTNFAKCVMMWFQEPQPPQRNNLIFILLAFVVLFSYSCKIDWNSNFKEIREDETYTTFYFYTEEDSTDSEGNVINGGYFSKRYEIGSDLEGTLLPQNTDSEILINSDGKTLLGWKFYRKTSDKSTNVPNTITIDDETNYVQSVKVSAISYDFVAVWQSETPTPDENEANYTVQHFWQKLSDDKTSAINEYELHESETLVGTIGEETQAVAKTYEGFTAQTFAQSTIAEDGSTVIFINYDRNSYTIKFDSNGGSGSVSEISAVYGGEYTIPDNTFTAQTGFKASANTWNSESDGSGTVYKVGDVVSNLATTDDATVTLYAVWLEIDAHSITYLDSDGSAISGMSPASFKESEKIDLSSAVPTKTGYIFNGWSESAVSTGATTYTTVSGWNAGEKTSDVTLYAVWSPISYTIAFNPTATDATGTMDSISAKYDENVTLTKNAFARTGYTFGGWGTASGGTLAGYLDGQSVSNLATTDGETVTLFAVWLENSYTIAFSANASDITGSMDDISAKYSEEVTLTANAYVRTGYSFGGWVLSSSKTDAADYDDNATVSKLSAISGDVITLYALWLENSYTIAFDKNADDATGSMASSNVTYSQEFTLSENMFTRTGYTFLGWAKSASASDKDYNDKATVSKLSATDNATVTLYAVWQKLSSSGGSTTTPFDNTTTFSATDCSSLTYGQENTITITAAATSGKAITWSPCVVQTSGGTTISDATYVSITTTDGSEVSSGSSTATCVVKFTSSMPPGNYYINVSATVNGVTYSDTITAVVVKKVSRTKSDIGNIYLANGNIVLPENFTKIDTANPPVAIVAYVDDNGNALGVGLHTSSSYLSMTPGTTNAYNTSFDGTVCTPSLLSAGAASTATFTGVTDGINNWSSIFAVVPDEAIDAATNFPAFNWANTYGSTYSSYLGGGEERLVFTKHCRTVLCI